MWQAYGIFERFEREEKKSFDTGRMLSFHQTHKLNQWTMNKKIRRYNVNQTVERTQKNEFHERNSTKNWIFF